MLSQVFVSQKSFSEAFCQNSLGPHGKRGAGKHRRCWERKRGAAPQKKGSARRTAPYNQSTESLYTVAEATGSHLTPRRSSLHRSFIYRHTRSKPSPGTGDRYLVVCVRGIMPKAVLLDHQAQPRSQLLTAAGTGW